MPGAPTDYADIAILVAAIGVTVSSIISAVAALVSARRTGAVRREVRTWNELTIGQLGEAEETRRIKQIAPDQRTTRESRHLTDSEGDQPE